jgi:hypothetical protein
MSNYDYQVSRQLLKDDPPFYALIMAAMRKADDSNLLQLRLLWPQVHQELTARYNAAGGILPGEDGYEELQAERKEAGLST